MSFQATASTSSSSIPATNFTVMSSVFKAMGMAVVIHRAEGLVKLPLMGKIKSVVVFSVTRKGTPIHSLLKGGSNPNFDSYGELMFNTTPSTIKDDCLVLQVYHHGGHHHLGKACGVAVMPVGDVDGIPFTPGSNPPVRILWPGLVSDGQIFISKLPRKRLLGKALVSLQLLMAGNGTGIEIKYPLLRDSKGEVGKLIVSHEIKQLEDLISPDLAAPTGSGSTATTQGRRRFKWSEAFEGFADGVSMAESAIELFGC